ncbi:MAG: PL29 family lyase N-terminal domain-containing protein [Proteiniphilum sp.]
MRKERFIKFFIFVLLATFVSFTSCQDYDDDIDKLKTDVSSLRSTLDAVQQKIESGSTITGVETTANGIIVKLSDGKSYTLTNGTNGADGSVVVIGENGNWFIDGIDTGKASKGSDGAKGNDGAKGKDGIYFTPAEDGFWHKVDGETVTPTTDRWLVEGSSSITATYEDGYVVLYNVAGSDDPITIGLVSLNNLVFIPEYVTEEGASVLNFDASITIDESKILIATAQYQVSPTNASEKLIDKEGLNFKFNNPKVLKSTTDLNPEAEFVSLIDGVLTVKASIDADALEGLEDNDDKIVQLMLIVPLTSGDEVVSDLVRVTSVGVVDITPAISVSPLADEISDEGGDVVFTIEASDAWEISELPEWITEKEKSETTVTLSIAQNAGEERSATITFSLVDYPMVTQEAAITQAAYDPPFVESGIFVKTTGVAANDGSSWEKATTLVKALEIAEEGDEIHIGAGTYVPTIKLTGGSAERDITFEINKNVTLIGGYPADASQGAVADKSNKTILSGNNQYYHTVTITAPVKEGEKVILRNISIKDGKAGAAGAGEIEVNGIQFLRNYGGGVSIGGSVVDFIDCELSDNNSEQYAGGGYIHNGAIASFIDSEILINTSTLNCAGLWPERATLYVIGCTVSDNVSGGVGGGFYNHSATSGQSKLYIYNSTISGNRDAAGNSGGIYTREGSYLRVVNSTISNNKTGINVYGTSVRPTVTDVISSTIYNNEGSTAAITTTDNTSLKIYNSIISGNAVSNGSFATNTATFSYSVLGDNVLDASGAAISGQTFDHNTMTPVNGAFAIPADSPAATFGMSGSLLQNLANSLTPPIGADIIMKDQLGSSRDGKTAMGAVTR